MHSRRPSDRVTALLAVLAMLLVGLTWATPMDAGARAAASTGAASANAATIADPVSAENDFIARINQLRASRGLGSLSVDPELTDQARRWASTMAGQGHIFHSGDLSVGITADWQKLGENVGVGGDTATLFQAFVDSPTHLANLVDPVYTRVGVGVVLSGNRMFTAHRFMGLAPPPPPPTTAPPTTAPPATVAPTTAPPTTVAPTTVPPAAVTTTTQAPVQHKLGPIDQLADLVADPDPGRGQRARTTS
jgi:hypothetical protein